MKGETSGRGETSSRRRSSTRSASLSRPIVEARRGGRQDFRHRALVHVGILPEVDRGEMEAEHVEGAPQRPQPTAGDDRAAVRPQRGVDHVEIGREFLDASVGRRVADRLAERHHMVELARGPGEARIHAGDRAPVGLVARG